MFHAPNVPRLLAVLLTAIAAPADAADPPIIAPGRWEIRIATRAGSDPNNKLPDRTARHCYTPAETRNLRKVLPTHINGEQCRLLETKRDGNRLTYRLQCDRNQLVSAGEMKFEDGRYEGIVVTELFGAEVGVGRIEQRIEGRRLGPCAK